MSISHSLALIIKQNIFSCLIILGPITKIANAPNDPNMILNVTSSKVNYICTTSNRESIFHSVLLYDRSFSR